MKIIKRISCIIPDYNEGKRVVNSIKAAKKYRYINEIIVINDGSTDDTKNILKKIKGIKLINLKENNGKSRAVMKGLEASRNNIIMLLDADLEGVNKGNLENLAKPILEDKADITISLRGNTVPLWKKIGLDFLSGERVFRKDLFQPSILKKSRGFSLECIINKVVIKRDYKIMVVKWENVRSPSPIEKPKNLIKGWKNQIKIVLDAAKGAGSGIVLLIQIIKMLKLRINDQSSSIQP